MEERLTQFTPNGYQLKEGQQLSAALEKLGKLEDLYDSLLSEQENIEQKMAVLRAQGKQKTVAFRQLMADKFQLIALLTRLHNI